MQATDYQNLEGLIAEAQDVKVLPLHKLATIVAIAAACWLPIISLIAEIWFL